MKKIRLVLALLILALSLAMLLWAFLPPIIESYTLPLPPENTELPTSFIWSVI